MCLACSYLLQEEEQRAMEVLVASQARPLTAVLRRVQHRHQLQAARLLAQEANQEAEAVDVDAEAEAAPASDAARTISSSVASGLP